MIRYVALVLLLPAFACGETQTWEQLMTEAAELRQAGHFSAASGRYARAEIAAADATTPDLALSVTRIAVGRLRREEGRIKLAEEIWRTELSNLEEKPLESLKAVLLHLGTFYTSQRRFAESESLLLRCLALYESSADDPSLPSALVGAGNLYLAQSKFDRAAELLQRALSLLDSRGDETLDTAIVAYTLAATYSRLGRTAEADLLFERSLQWGRSNLGPSDARLAVAMIAFARHLRQSGRKQRGKELEKAAKLLGRPINVSDHVVDINSLRADVPARR